MCNTNDWLGQFIKALLRKLMSCEDKRETQDIRSPNLGPGPNFEIKFHPSEKSKGMAQLCACTHVCDPDNLLSASNHHLSQGILLPSRVGHIWGLQDLHQPLWCFMKQNQSNLMVPWAIGMVLPLLTQGAGRLSKRPGMERTMENIQ